MLIEPTIPGSSMSLASLLADLDSLRSHNQFLASQNDILHSSVSQIRCQKHTLQTQLFGLQAKWLTLARFTDASRLDCHPPPETEDKPLVFLSLPVDIVMAIIRECSQATLYALSLTCRALRTAATNQLFHRPFLNTFVKGYTFRLACSLDPVPRLEELREIECQHWTDWEKWVGESVKAGKKCRKLVTATLGDKSSGIRLFDTLELLSNLGHNLGWLTLANGWPDPVSRSGARVRALRSLKLAHFDLRTASIFETLSKSLPALESLEIELGPFSCFNESNLEALNKFRLKTLALSGKCTALWDNETSVYFETLEHLRLSLWDGTRSESKSKVMPHIEGLFEGQHKHLQTLHLDFCFHAGRQLRTAFQEYLFPVLESFDVGLEVEGSIAIEERRAEEMVGMAKDVCDAAEIQGFQTHRVKEGFSGKRK